MENQSMEIFKLQDNQPQFLMCQKFNRLPESQIADRSGPLIRRHNLKQHQTKKWSDRNSAWF